MLRDYLRGGRVPAHLRRGDGRLALLDVGSYFTSFSGFTPVERELVSIARGAVLDVGAGAGRFGVHLCSAAGSGGPVTEVVALDSSAGACECMRQLGLEVVVHSSWERVAEARIWSERFDTVLLGGTGFGIAGNPEVFPALLRWLARCLRPGGLVLGTAETCSQTDAEAVRLRVEYQGRVSEWFCWLRVRPDRLAAAAVQAGLRPRRLYIASGLEVEARRVDSPGVLELPPKVCEYGIALVKRPGAAAGGGEAGDVS